MDPGHLAPTSAIGTPNKEMQIKDAKDMYQVVLRNAERSNSKVPPYEFLELIGKGASGRVYKCRSKATGDVVAVKIVNIDAEDYSSDALDKDDTLNSFRKEVAILQQLKDSKARNVNLIHDAFDLHNQLWIISDYCTGGSVRTLMRANPTNKGLEEHFIVPIARELAKAIKSVHDIGVIHRDIKCTNVYISEVGDIQLGDFGIVGVIDDGDGSSKRKTIIGTPHFMPREMLYASDSHLTEEGYGKEVDIWAFGCTVYEMATGSPPNATVFPQNLPMALERAPRLNESQHSAELCEFVAYCLESDPLQRPSINAILNAAYISGSESRYPTRSLVNLIDRYTVWELRGGQRQSLFMRGGAAAPSSTSESDSQEDNEHDWNFSTSDNFTQAFTRRMSQMVATRDFANGGFGGPMDGLATNAARNLTPLEQFEQFHKEQSANRGERSLDRLWNPDSTPYELHIPVEDLPIASDLPLRNFGAAQPRESLIDLDSVGTSAANTQTKFNFDFDDLPTMKARTSRDTRSSQYIEEEDEDNYSYSDYNNEDKRATMEWTFPTSAMPSMEPDSQTIKRGTMDWTFPNAALQAEKRDTMAWTFASAGTVSIPEGTESEPTSATSDDDLPFRPTLKHSATEPLGHFRDFDDYAQASGPPTAHLIRDSLQSMIDLDLSNADSSDPPRPRTASSAAASVTSINPFDLEEDPVQHEIDLKRFSYHKPWQSEGGGSRISRTSSYNIQSRSRANSLLSSDSERVSMIQQSDMKRRPNIASDPWTDVESSSGLDDEETYPTVRMPRSGFGGLGNPRRRNRSNPQYGGFQLPAPPHPDAMREGAPAALLQSELDRLLDHLDAAFDETSRAFMEYVGPDYDETSEAESGTTGDEDES